MEERLEPMLAGVAACGFMAVVGAAAGLEALLRDGRIAKGFALWFRAAVGLQIGCVESKERTVFGATRPDRPYKRGTRLSALDAARDGRAVAELPCREPWDAVGRTLCRHQA